MSKVKTHLIKDEKLGGIIREYVEVNRQAEVGETIVITNVDDLNGDGYVIGHMAKVTGTWANEYTGTSGVEDEENISYFNEEYSVLEPTDIVIIDSQRYELIKRKANVGEKVIDLVNDGNAHFLEIVEPPYEHDAVWYEFKTEQGTDIAPIKENEYLVLVPVEENATEELISVSEKDASPEVFKMLGDLASRITSLESTLGSNKSTVGRLQDIAFQNYIEQSPCTYSKQYLEKLKKEVDLLTEINEKYKELVSLKNN